MQGEGPWVGRPTVFVRFAGCDLRCGWCDSPETWKWASQCRFERTAGSADFETVANPVSLEEIMARIQDLQPRPGSFVALTGGEPLLQPDLVEGVAKASQAMGLRTYLETHGLAVNALGKLLPAIDVVAMDWKLASDVRPATPDGVAPDDFADRHRAFLASAVSDSEVAVKVVLTRLSENRELERVCDAMTEVAPRCTLILQPVTPFGSTRETVPAQRLMELVRRCEARLSDVRLIPQTHKIYGAL